MRLAAILIVGTVLACNSWARIGETPDEALERYGLPRDSHAGMYSNTIVRVYNKDGIQVEAIFMVSNSGKSVIGEIRYLLPRELSQSNEVAKAVLTQLLEANAAGTSWELQRNLPTTQEYSRTGAIAIMTLTSLTVILNEFAEYISTVKSRIIKEQTIRIDKNLKDF